MISRVNGYFASLGKRMLIFIKPLPADPKYGESFIVQQNKEASRKLKNALGQVLDSNGNNFSGDIMAPFQCSFGVQVPCDPKSLGCLQEDCSQVGDQLVVTSVPDISGDSSQLFVTSSPTHDIYIFLYENAIEDYNALKEQIRLHNGLSRKEKRLLTDKIDLIMRRDLYGVSVADLFDDGFNEELGGLV